MPRITSRLPLLALLLAAQAALVGSASAQSTQPAPPQSNQNQAPPKLERVEPGSDVPATNIPARTRTQIKETRDGGQVTEVDVNSSGSHYTMKPANPPGAVPAGPGATTAIRAPQWKVGEFDLSGKRKAANETGTNTPAPADVPPPPPLPAGTPDKK